MSDKKFDCELLRPVEYICEPNSGTALFGKQLVDYHKDMAVLNLNNKVPREIFLQFETAKNLYLYGWFVWRFFTVSEQHALLCLELALRTRYGEIIPKKKYFPKHKEPGLKALLQFAVDEQYIKNEEFETWRRITLNKARSRYKFNKLKEMRENGLSQIQLNYDEIEIGDEDKDWNYVELLSKSLPDTRNEYAHGSTSVQMFHGPCHTIQLVSEIINQIYSSEP